MKLRFNTYTEKNRPFVLFAVEVNWANQNDYDRISCLKQEKQNLSKKEVEETKGLRSIIWEPIDM